MARTTKAPSAMSVFLFIASDLAGASAGRPPAQTSEGDEEDGDPDDVAALTAITVPSEPTSIGPRGDGLAADRRQRLVLHRPADGVEQHLRAAAVEREDSARPADTRRRRSRSRRPPSAAPACATRRPACCPAPTCPAARRAAGRRSSGSPGRRRPARRRRGPWGPWPLPSSGHRREEEEAGLLPGLGRGGGQRPELGVRRLRLAARQRADQLRPSWGTGRPPRSRRPGSSCPCRSESVLTPTNTGRFFSILRPPTSIGPGTFWRSNTKSSPILKPYFSSSSFRPVWLTWPTLGCGRHLRHPAARRRQHHPVDQEDRAAPLHRGSCRSRGAPCRRRPAWGRRPPARRRRRRSPSTTGSRWSSRTPGR